MHVCGSGIVHSPTPRAIIAILPCFSCLYLVSLAFSRVSPPILLGTHLCLFRFIVHSAGAPKKPTTQAVAQHPGALDGFRVLYGKTEAVASGKEGPGHQENHKFAFSAFFGRKGEI